MRKLMICTSLAAIAMATPASARDDSWYIEADVGAIKAQDLENLSGFGNQTGELDTKTGYDVGGIVGYDFGMFRLEAEASQRRVGAKTFSIPLGSTAPVGLPVPANGSAKALSFMVNALLDVGSDDGLQGFIGGGVGVGRVKVDVHNATITQINDSDTRLAFQGLAGVRYAMSDNVDVGLKYRYYYQDHNDLITQAGLGARTRFRSHSLMLTLGYNFGGAEAPPPPPPPVAECNKGPYIVFFDWDKSDITPEAASILDSAVTAYGSCANVPVMLAGFADRSGKPSYNQGLSERRNTSVTAYLTGRGIPAGAITSQGFGESNNRVPTADGVRELQNRRVEITYGPGSGM
jgi:OmpA-OmpF porin, OOP family